MRVLAAQHGVQLDELALPVERFEVVRDGHQVGFRRQPVRRMAPVRVGEGTELAAIDERLDAVADAREVLRARQRPVRNRLGQRRRLRGIGRERRHDVDPIERVQVIEVDHVVLHALRADDQVAQQPRVGRRHRTDGVFDGANRGDGVHGGAHAADALREGPGVTRIAPLQDQLDPAEHRRRRPGVAHGAAVDLGLDAEVPFDPGHRVDDDAAHDPSFFVVVGVNGSALSPTRFMI